MQKERDLRFFETEIRLLQVKYVFIRLLSLQCYDNGSVEEELDKIFD